MKYTKFSLFLGFIVLMSAVGCSDDEPGITVTVDAGLAQTVSLDETVTLDASGSENAISFVWTVTGPDGADVILSDATAAMPTFVATLPGVYQATVVVNDDQNLVNTVTITVGNDTYSRADYMGRPAINTVFNFFGTSGGKDEYNEKNLPSAPVATSEQFEFILDKLQEYAGLNSDVYTNALGLDNTQTADVLIVDALNSHKDFPTTYGPSDLNDIRLFETVLNGRGLEDDVVDVTLTLTFGGDLTDAPAGLIGDNVSYTSNSTSTFPYLGSPN
ncbi:DUF4331 domain-containing protein [Fulvivirga sp. M361]|uniref:PKD domain-containing protein n=1 Tax=Fulvivirga sp. M361 TaxID=2594266 RepID=UPI00117A6833|nr:DUF4331 family protein [Fulvivirga sp. M361]TRX56212.1 DUF4331 domain-containing protein [Fulvivirga sp. M361]